MQSRRSRLADLARRTGGRWRPLPRLALIALCSLLIVQFMTPVLQVQGEVRDAQTGAPVPDAVATAGSNSSRTGPDGRYALGLVAPWAGVQVVAFASDDIFASVQQWRAAGVPMMPVPDNYYDDLATRFDMEPALLERLREHGVLFDRTADGDYFHAGTQAFADRFHFEVVQRSGGYDGYGALNAPIRMAWQAQAESR